MSKIEQALLRLFDKHRIVFWYDSKQELRGEFDELWLPEVEKFEMTTTNIGLNITSYVRNNIRNSFSTRKVHSPAI